MRPAGLLATCENCEDRGHDLGCTFLDLCYILGVPGGNPGNQPLGIAGHGGAPAVLSNIPMPVYRQAGVNLPATAWTRLLFAHHAFDYRMRGGRISKSAGCKKGGLSGRPSHCF